MIFVFILFYFFLYSFIGWIIDTGYRSAWARAYTSGSFFPLPLCPIYGFGALLVLSLQQTISFLPILVQWGVYAILLATLEYVTGVVILRVYNKRLWQYPGGLLNVKQFTNLSHAAIWGALAMCTVWMYPIVQSLFCRIFTQWCM